MKSILFGVLGFFFLTCFSQNKEQQAILDKFISYHNDGTEKAIVEFVKETYNADLYAKIDLGKHRTFYKQIANEFGPLNNQIYKIEFESRLKLIVHLIKEDESVLNRNIDPREILVVEIDVADNNSKYLSRGLGLGALVCEVRKE